MTETNLQVILGSLDPVLHADVYVFCLAPADWKGPTPVFTFREAEGLTLVLEESQAGGLEPLFRAASLTLNVLSDLSAVGLTAAVATALAEAGISCNVVAAVHHDHLFVPIERGEDALAVLRALQKSAAANLNPTSDV